MGTSPTNLILEIERLRGILRRCMPGTHPVKIGPGEYASLYFQGDPYCEPAAHDRRAV